MSRKENQQRHQTNANMYVERPPLRVPIPVAEVVIPKVERRHERFAVVRPLPHGRR